MPTLSGDVERKDDFQTILTVFVGVLRGIVEITVPLILSFIGICIARSFNADTAVAGLAD
ncbi:hypothetical protein P4C99_18225 [Pontiellaceae bacterium B1224]|nr:hypothetical protein [Pontiellaceae bacterium B1224]